MLANDNLEYVVWCKWACLGCDAMWLEHLAGCMLEHDDSESTVTRAADQRCAGFRAMQRAAANKPCTRDYAGLCACD
jgi:hypothetical protein